MSEEKVIDAEFEEDGPGTTADDVTKKAAERFIPSKTAKVVCDVIDAVEKPLRRVSVAKADSVASASARLKEQAQKADESIKNAIEVQEELKGVAAAVKEAAPQAKAAWEAVKETGKKVGAFIGKVDKARGSSRFKRSVF